MTHEIRFEADNTYRHRFILQNDVGAPIDLSTGVLTIVVSTKASRTLAYTWTIGAELTVIGAEADGIVELILLPDSVVAGSYVLNFRLVVGANVYERLAFEMMVFGS